MTTLTDQLWDRAYELQSRWPDDQSGIAELLDDLISCADETNDTSLLRGYLAYHFPCDETYEIDIETELKRASLFNSTSTTAHLYLAHYYYDSHRFGDALDELNLLDRTQFEHAGQLWRSLKILELILSAQLFARPISVSSHELIKFASELQSAGAENTAVPVEMLDALLANKQEVLKFWTMEQLATVVRALRIAINEIADNDTLKEKLDSLIA